MPFIVDGVKAAEKQVDVARPPVLAIGYSRGGAIAVDMQPPPGETSCPLPADHERLSGVGTGTRGT